jgi:ABC-type uncharacterized transport system substrate-binding protein
MDEGASKAFAGAAELIRSNVGVVVTFGPEIALKAAVAASQTTPIVMIAVNFDPIAGGYVSDLARPNGNITGLVSFPKITSVRIRAVQQNQRMIQRDARGPDSDWSACRQPVQVAAPT